MSTRTHPQTPTHAESAEPQTQIPTDTPVLHIYDPALTHASVGNGARPQRTQCARNHRSVGANTEHHRARNKHRQPMPRRLCTTASRWKWGQIAHPKWSSRSSLSIPPMLTSSISTSEALEACATKRGRLQTSLAGGAGAFAPTEYRG